MPHAEQVRSFIDAGADLIQIREKNASAREFYFAALEAVAVAREHDVLVIINDRVDIALAVGAAGVHLGQEDLSPAAARAVLGPDAIIGYSTHTLEQALAAVKLPVDYIAFGPIFPTSTKKDPDPVVGLSRLSEIRKAIGKMPLVAIGGIRFENAGSVLAAGADSVAVISDLLTGPDAIERRYREFAELADSIA